MLKEDLEIPFPKPLNHPKPDESSATNSQECDPEKPADNVHDGQSNGTEEATMAKVDVISEDPFNESIPIRQEHLKMLVCL